MKVLQTKEFKSWLEDQEEFVQADVLTRVYRIENNAHFGDIKYLGNSLAELRWKNGLRIYFCRVGEKMVLFLLGGNKSEQKKNIKKARLIISKHADY